MSMKKTTIFFSATALLISFLSFGISYATAEDSGEAVTITSESETNQSSNGSQDVKSKSTYERDSSTRTIDQGSVTNPDQSRLEYQVVEEKTPDGKISGEGYVEEYDANGNLVDRYITGKRKELAKENPPPTAKKNSNAPVPVKEKDGQHDVFVKSWWTIKATRTATDTQGSDVSTYTLRIYEEYEGDWIKISPTQSSFSILTKGIPRVLEISGEENATMGTSSYRRILKSCEFNDMELNGGYFAVNFFRFEDKKNKWAAISGDTPIITLIGSPPAFSPNDITILIPLAGTIYPKGNETAAVNIDDILEGRKIERRWHEASTSTFEDGITMDYKADCGLEAQIILSPSSKKKLRNSL